MSIEIAKMTNATMQSWATKCDANFDGKIDNNEMSVFQQGADSMHEGDWGRGQHVTIGGVEIPVRDIEFIRKDNKTEGQNDYFVKFTSGCSIKYPEQDENSKARISSSISGYHKDEPVETHTIVDNMSAKPKEVKFTGTSLNDFVDMLYSQGISINGKRGVDFVRIADNIDPTSPNMPYTKNIEGLSTPAFSSGISMADFRH